MAGKAAYVTVRMTPDMANQLKELADRDERSISQIVRLAIKQYLQAQGPQKGIKPPREYHAPPQP